jgi:hypothetical protein
MKLADCQAFILFAGLLALATLNRAIADTPPAGSVVTTVQPPAWLRHGNDEVPLRPGMTVADGDQLRTAEGGRIYLALPELSTVKIGANTRFSTTAMDMTADSQGSLFKSALQVLKGVFRFTTSLEGKAMRRNVEISVVTATIGIRGTDVWGRAGDDGGLVALLEGKISMDMPGHADMKMDEPMHYMTMNGSGAMEMNLPVTPDKVADWAGQTDVKPGSGVLSTGGHWTIALLSSPAEADTQPLLRRLAVDGYPAEDSNFTRKGKSWHRLVIRQLASYRDARTLADRLQAVNPGIKPWILKETADGTQN